MIAATIKVNVLDVVETIMLINVIFKKGHAMLVERKVT